MPNPDCTTTDPEWPFGYGLCHCGCGRRTTLAPQTDRAQGYTKGQPRQYIRGHHSRRTDIAGTFWQMVDMSTGQDGCWPWTGPRSGAGYGRFSYSGRRYPAHRIAYELLDGHIPAGLLVCHRCDNPPCYNPAHLFLGTMADNMADMVSKGRQNKGERHHWAVYTEAQMSESLTMYRDGVSWADILARTGVSKCSVYFAARGRSWKHLTTPS